MAPGAAAAETDEDEMQDYIAWRTAKFRLADGSADEEKMASGRWLFTRDFRLRDGGVICVATDITALKNALTAEESARQRSDCELPGAFVV